MTFLSQASPGLLAALVILASVGVAVILLLIVAAIVRLAKWRQIKVQKFRYEIDAAQKTLLVIEKEKRDCQEKVARLNAHKDSLARAICELNMAIGLKQQTRRKYDEDIQDLSKKVKDLEAAIKEKEDKLLKTIMIEIEIGSEKRRVSI